MMAIKLVVDELTYNIVSSNTPQSGLYEEVKRYFWDNLDEFV